MEELIKDSRFLAAIITALVTFLISIVSSVISLITNHKNRQLIREVEYLKSELQKETIAYQIYQTELAKKRFEKLDHLYSKLVEYASFQRDKVGTDYNLFVDPVKLAQESRDLYFQTRTIFVKSQIFLNSELKSSIADFLDNCKKITDNYYLREQGEKNDWSKYLKAMDKHVKEIQPTIDKIEDLIKEYLNEPK